MALEPEALIHAEAGRTAGQAGAAGGRAERAGRETNRGGKGYERCMGNK